MGARCRISSHAFIGEGATIEDAVFIGHEVCFTNDGLPRDCRTVGTLQSDQDWTVIETRVSRRATIGSAAMIFPGVTIGKSAVVRAGAVFTRDVVLRTIAVGNPARVLHRLRDGEAR